MKYIVAIIQPDRLDEVLDELDAAELVVASGLGEREPAYLPARPLQDTSVAAGSAEARVSPREGAEAPACVAPRGDDDLVPFACAGRGAASLCRADLGAGRSRHRRGAVLYGHADGCHGRRQKLQLRPWQLATTLGHRICR